MIGAGADDEQGKERRKKGAYDFLQEMKMEEKKTVEGLMGCRSKSSKGHHRHHHREKKKKKGSRKKSKKQDQSKMS